MTTTPVPADRPVRGRKPRSGARSTFGAVIGVAGTGKTRLLDTVVAAITKNGVTVVRFSGSRGAAAGTPTPGLRSLGSGDEIASPQAAAAWLLARLGEPPWLLAVDDAHWLDQPTLAAVTEVAKRAIAVGGGVTAAHRPVRDAGIEALDTAITGGKDAIVLRPWTVAKVAALPAVGGDAERAAAIVTATGGNPRLATILAGSPQAAAEAVPEAALDVIRTELDLLPPEARLAVTAMAAGKPVDVSPAVLAALVSGALATPDGKVIPLVSSALGRIEGGEAGPVASLLVDLIPEPDSDGLRAERAWREGDTVAAIEAADRALASGADPDCLAAGVAAAGAAADGALFDAANRWRGIAAALNGVPSTLAAGRAALTAGLVGDLEAALQDLAGARRTLSASARSRGLTVLLDGVDAVTQAVRGDFDRAARRLAGLAVAAVPADPLAPGQWDDLAVTAMVAGGDDRTARDMLTAYRDQPPTIRRRLLAAWLDLRSGRLADARNGLAAAGDRPILRRDAVLAAAVTVGLARRASGDEALRATWRRVAPVVAGADVELLLLDAWGELSAAAAQVSSIERDGIVETMSAAVARAGTPPWCAATEAWWQLQRAVAAGDLATATAAAERLTTLAEADGRFQLRTMAAREWASVLGRVVDPRSVARTAKALADADQAGDAAALCSAAADLLGDQAAARELLGTGRAFRARIATDDRAADRHGLSSRERAVGELLIEGLTHKEIGARLYISPKTVEQHVAKLRQKLLASNRSELVAALRARLDVD